MEAMRQMSGIFLDLSRSDENAISAKKFGILEFGLVQFSSLNFPAEFFKKCQTAKADLTKSEIYGNADAVPNNNKQEKKI